MARYLHYMTVVGLIIANIIFIFWWFIIKIGWITVDIPNSPSVPHFWCQARYWRHCDWCSGFRVWWHFDPRLNITKFLFYRMGGRSVRWKLHRWINVLCRWLLPTIMELLKARLQLKVFRGNRTSICSNYFLCPIQASFNELAGLKCTNEWNDLGSKCPLTFL